VSHPFMPQPYYLVRQSRLSAPWPAPMGAYTAGIFDDTYLNMPDYIHEDRIAGDGWYEGYGQSGGSSGFYNVVASGVAQVPTADGKVVSVDAGPCTKAAEAAAKIAPYVRDALLKVTPASLDLPLVGSVDVATKIRNADFVPALTKAINAVAAQNQEFQKAAPTIIYWGVTEIVGETVADLMNDAGLFQKAATEIMSQLPGGNICPPAFDELGYAKQKRDAYCRDPEAGNTVRSCEIWTKVVQLMEGGASLKDAQVLAQGSVPAFQTPAVKRLLSMLGAGVRAGYAIPVVGSLRTTASASALAKIAAGVSPTSYITPETAGGIVAPTAAAAGGTVALLGAAALALLLLRR